VEVGLVLGAEGYGVDYSGLRGGVSRTLSELIPGFVRRHAHFAPRPTVTSFSTTGRSVNSSNQITSSPNAFASCSSSRTGVPFFLSLTGAGCRFRWVSYLERRLDAARSRRLGPDGLRLAFELSE
jgi:hypothetical protein